MVLAELRKRLYREEGRREGREEGREETQRVWEAWNERRIAAERDGEPFAEPPPTRNSSSASSAH